MTSSTSSPSKGHSQSNTGKTTAVASSLTNSCNVPSILSFAADARKGKTGENRIVDAHLLRLLYNWHLQWHLVNVRADASMLLQRLIVEGIDTDDTTKTASAEQETTAAAARRDEQQVKRRKPTDSIGKRYRFSHPSFSWRVQTSDPQTPASNRTGASKPPLSTK
ncbi:hypothetical protein NE237_006037 [Protea cynaroides]|uniref:Uncharacterized protein n=1 Tax=Protea cynaroides TaxID=273540 RepID=A0A9Q0KLL2_9MAGN|nr:hypothetical protein NE237_006037 [Protea cynaroides]